MAMRGRLKASVVGLALLLGSHLGAAPASAQAPAAPAATPANPASVEVDPIRCWWRTSVSAVRVGEPFSLVLTCAVVESQAATVIPDQSKLEPGAIQLLPFDVIGGAHGPDLRSGSRRFFQYQYTLRLISEDLFGKDAKIPSLQIDYVIESHVAGGESVRGIPRTYLMPVEPVRIASLVPQDDGDIRDMPAGTFADIDQERFRARALLLAAGVLAAAGGLLVLVALLRLVRGRRQASVARRALLSNPALLRAAGRELRAVRRPRRREGWTDDLAGRALAAARIAGRLALGTRVSQARAGVGMDAQAGQLGVRGGTLWTRRIHLSGAATAEAIGQELERPRLGSNRRVVLAALQTGLAGFTASQFSRDGQLDEMVLDEALGETMRVLPRLAVEQFWVVRRLRDLTSSGTAAETRAWSR